MKKIKLDIVSDVVCPWCIVGYKHLSQAISELGLQEQVEIEWQPFELNPDMPAEGENLRDHIMRKYGSTKEQSDQAREDLKNRGEVIGFEFNFAESTRMVNTRDAHILLEYAKEHGKQMELKLRLFSAYFSEGKDVSNHQVLADELTALGLNADEALMTLTDEARNHIAAQEFEWHQMGISSVPTVVFNRTSALNGAHPVESYKQVLRELAAEAS